VAEKGAPVPRLSCDLPSNWKGAASDSAAIRGMAFMARIPLASATKSKQKPPISTDALFARFWRRPLMQLRRVNTIPRLLALLLAAVTLHGCASTDYHPLESQAPLVGQGPAAGRARLSMALI
jgi:hypothetical protein